jgi:hypothetical protein
MRIIGSSRKLIQDSLHRSVFSAPYFNGPAIIEPVPLDVLIGQYFAE